MKDTNSFLYKIEIHSMYLNKYKLNSNSTIEFEFSEKQLVCKLVENYSISSFEYVVQKTIQDANMKRHLSMLLHLGMN
jgi:hypothetical protein